MCYNGFEPGDTESERESAEPWESDGALPFLEDDGTDETWRLGPMGPEEEMYRKLIEGGEDGS